MYRIEFSEKAQKDLLVLQRSSPKSMKKLRALMAELREHPRTGTGHVEVLRYQQGVEIYSRHIDKKNRMLYRIYDDVVEVYLISLLGHYDDK